MVFGKFQGDKRLVAQRAGLAESLELLSDLERRLLGASALHVEFAAVWGAGMPPGFAEELGKVRGLADLLAGRAKIATSTLPDFDEAAAFVKRQLGVLDQRWKAFVALLLARKTIGRAEASVGECQRALVAIADDLHAALIADIEDMRRIEPDFGELAEMAHGMDGVREALGLYRGKLSSGEGELSESSTATLMDLISMMQTKLLWIEGRRADLAVEIAMTAAFRNA